MAVDETINNLLKELKQERKSHHKVCARMRRDVKRPQRFSTKCREVVRIRFVLVLQRFVTFSANPEVEPKLSVTCLLAFFRVSRRQHVFASSSDWLIGLYACSVISQTYYIGFGVTTLNLSE